MTNLDVYSNGWLRMDVEEYDQNAFVHIYVEDWSVSKRKQLHRAIEDCATALKALGYRRCFATVLKHDKLLKKFLLMVGMRPYVTVDTVDPPYEIWTRGV